MLLAGHLVFPISTALSGQARSFGWSGFQNSQPSCFPEGWQYIAGSSGVMVQMFTESASARLCRTFTEKVWSSRESRPDLAQRALAAFIGGSGR